MKKYLIITLAIMLSSAWLLAQESDPSQSKETHDKSDPAIVPDDENDPDSSAEKITISGPDGVIIQEPALNYSIRRQKYSMDEDKSLQKEKRVENDLQQIDEEDMEIIYEPFPEVKKSAPYNSGHENKSDIKTLSGKDNHNGGFGAVSFRYSDFRGEPMVMAGFRAGWIENRTVAIGFEGHGVIPTTRYGDIDTFRDMMLVGGYGGMFLELILFSNQAVHVTFPVAAGAGWLGYTAHWDNDFMQTFPENRNGLADHDTFWYIEPGANLEFNVSRTFRMCFGMSRRYTRDFLLINTSENAFEKPNYYLTLKFGRF